ncbi:FIST N-terminal domain-containing protein [Methanococcus voltae]|uniref:FIST domain-containing protein n=1 Tax=Methanococcus voltae (strain ATCC BAA-1334 / A3) TaxID=456320 RepID=D7DTL4_METV3|nr:FIST N-terminal domain-containing protein [Methanococcus voltae]MCS3901326.1 hypothetical protein [Methanococcus voltae]
MQFIQYGFGTSEDNNPLKAGAHATSDALKNIEKHSESPTIAFLYSSPEYNPEEVLNGVRLVLDKNTPIVGSSSNFQIVNKKVVSNGVSVGILSSKYISVGIGVDLGASVNPKEAGRNAVRDAIDNLGMSPKLIYVLMDFCKSEVSVMESIIDEVGYTIPIFGGISSDNLEFKKMYQYCNDSYFDSVVCVAFGGDLIPKISYGRYKNTEEDLNITEVVKNNKNTKNIKDNKNTKDIKNTKNIKDIKDDNDNKIEKFDDIHYLENKLLITENTKRKIIKINGKDAIEQYKELIKYNGSVNDLKKDKQFYLANPVGMVANNEEIYLKGPVNLLDNHMATASYIRNHQELKHIKIDNNIVDDLFNQNIDILENSPPYYNKPAITFCTVSTMLMETHKDLLTDRLEQYKLGDLLGLSTYGEIIFGDIRNYDITMCGICPDLVSISAKEGIHMITKHPATRETLIKIDELGGSVKVEELAKALGIHRRSAYDRVDPILKHGFAEKENAIIQLTEFGKILLKFGLIFSKKENQ